MGSTASRSSVEKEGRQDRSTDTPVMTIPAVSGEQSQDAKPTHPVHTPMSRCLYERLVRRGRQDGQLTDAVRAVELVSGWAEAERAVPSRVGLTAVGAALLFTAGPAICKQATQSTASYKIIGHRVIWTR